MTTDIKERLRQYAGDAGSQLAIDAANHIEQLEGQLSAQRQDSEQSRLMLADDTSPRIPQRQDSNKGSENIAFIGQCHPGCHAKPSASMGVCHTMFCPVRDIANGAPK